MPETPRSVIPRVPRSTTAKTQRSHRRLSRLRWLLVGIVLGLLLVPTLHGCLATDSSLARVLETLKGASYEVSEDTKAEYGRFVTVYRAHAADPEDSRPLKHFEDAFLRVRAHYLEEVPDARLVNAAIQGVQGLEAEAGTAPSAMVVETALHSMLSSLDPYSSYLNAEEFRETMESTRGEFGGLGIEVTLEDGIIKVISPIEGTPAYRAGIKPDDRITHLDDVSIRGMTLTEAVTRMRGAPGTDIRLRIERRRVAPFEVTVTRAVITEEAVRWRLEGDIGYLRVMVFSEHTAADLETAIAEMHAAAQGRLAGVVVDLRRNPGGLFDQSLAVADAFLEEGVIVSVRGRDPNDARIYEAEAGDLFEGLPMVVLIDGGSASAAEIVASALKEDKRAVVMGQRSYGKAMVQTITPLPLEGALKLTTARYYTPAGHMIDGKGVVPDVRLDESGETTPAGTAEAAETSPFSVRVETCPAAGEAERPDRALGCALVFLKAGSPERFMERLALAPPAR